jgi:spore coat polysaccharide biosynthesis predicted glycosyltransferase SpsG
MIGFRVDGNKQIGMGHFSRCISIASSLKEKTSDFCFIGSEDSSCENLISLG